MAFDVIVFNQEELLRALEAGVKSIALCDNCFSLPDIDGIHYTIIGDVTIEGIDVPEYKEDKPQSFGSSYSGSFSESGSYGGSGQSSFAYEYEFSGSYANSYASSYSSSYASEYLSSYETSFASSFYSFISGMSFEWGGSYGGSFALGYSFEFGGSYAGSYGYGGSFDIGSGGSYNGSYAMLPDIIEYGSSGIIFVNGYGINLI